MGSSNQVRSGNDDPVLLVNSREQEEQQPEWARLIPGEMPHLGRGRKKAAHSLKAFSPEKRFGTATNSDNGEHQTALARLRPAPLKTRTARKWLRCMAADWALVSLNWLLTGAALVPLRTILPTDWFALYPRAPSLLLGIAVLHAALITLVGYTEGLYVSGIDLEQQSRILGKSVLLATSVLCFAYLLEDSSWTTAVLCCATGVLHFAALRTWRWRIGGYELLESQASVRNVLIAGAGGVGRRIASYLEQDPMCGRKVCGFLDNESPIGNGVIGRVTDLARIARREFADEVILAAPRNSNLTRYVVSEARRLHLDVDIVPDLGAEASGQEVDRLGDLPLLCLHEVRLPAVGLFLKRLLDVAAGSLALVILLPLLAWIAAMIKLDSGGPVLYCAARAGRKGRLFRCFKFRTMVSNADHLKARLQSSNERAGPFFKIADDPRVTRVGRFLRRYSLDELPQLWNVIRGEMSLVGPRPHPLDDLAGYEMEHLARLDVTPGLTGLWQVTARRDPSFRRGMELDREYIRTWSLGLDLRILLRTFRAVVEGSGQ